MKLLVDTHLLLWSTVESEHLSLRARNSLEDLANELFFSSASIWEIVLKAARPKNNLRAEARVVRDRLLSIGYHELTVTSEHAISAAALPPIHQDPFDRLLLAQAILKA